MEYRERCSIMEACIPASEFKHQVVKLHVDILEEIESLRDKLAESEKDAERYQFIKNTCLVILPDGTEVEDDAMLDAAIAKGWDYAMG